MQSYFFNKRIFSKILFLFLNKKQLLTSCVFFIFSLFASTNINAQKLSIKTNLIDIATLSPNLGIDIVLCQHSSISLDAIINPWSIKSYNFNHLKLSAEYRYWFSETLFKHYIGAGISAGSYKVDAFNQNYNEDYVSIGLSYGYSIILNSHWNIEPSIGLGCAYKQNKRIENSSPYFGFQITRIGFSLIYIIG